MHGMKHVECCAYVIFLQVVPSAGSFKNTKIINLTPLW